MDDPIFARWLPPNVSLHGGEIDLMLHLIHWFMIALFVGWGVFMVYCLVRFRQRPNHVAVYQPVKAKFSKWLEVGVAVAEAIVLVVLAVPVWGKIKDDIPQQMGNDPVVIRVVAEQFKWLFHYPGRDGVFGATGVEFYSDDNPAGLDDEDEAGWDDITVRGLHFPVGRPVIARLITKDVIHSFKIPVMRITQDAVPGMEIPIWFQAIAPGKFQVGCAQLCGMGHYEMKADLTIHKSQDEFQAWLDDEHENL